MAELSHHKQKEPATNRPSYRDSRQEKAVKVYTVNQESKYLLIFNVPALGVTNELIKLFSVYGEIEEYRLLDEYPCEEYTDVCLIKYNDNESARQAKRKLDNHYFYSKNLHVCYGPEYETVQETREKLEKRKQFILQKTRSSKVSSSGVPQSRPPPLLPRPAQTRPLLQIPGGTTPPPLIHSCPLLPSPTSHSVVVRPDSILPSLPLPPRSSLPRSSLPHSSHPHSSHPPLFSHPHSFHPHSSLTHPHSSHPPHFSLPHSSHPHSSLPHSSIPHSSIPHSSHPHSSHPPPLLSSPNAPLLPLLPPPLLSSSSVPPLLPTPINAPPKNAPPTNTPPTNIIMTSDRGKRKCSSVDNISLNTPPSTNTINKFDKLPLTGNSSFDSTITSVRHKMSQVFYSTQVTPPTLKKRKRI